jgi:hypothetical protein
MSLVNTKAIEKEIKIVTARLSYLNQLLDLANRAEGSARPGRKKGAVKRESQSPTRAPKRKRGMVTAGIQNILESADAPVTSGEIRKTLIDAKVIRAESNAIYSQLQQMAKRGLINKVKHKNGVAYKRAR